MSECLSDCLSILSVRAQLKLISTILFLLCKNIMTFCWPLPFSLESIGKVKNMGISDEVKPSAIQIVLISGGSPSKSHSEETKAHVYCSANRDYCNLLSSSVLPCQQVISNVAVCHLTEHILHHLFNLCIISQSRLTSINYVHKWILRFCSLDKYLGI